MATIMRFSVSEMKPRGTLLSPTDAGAFELAPVHVNRLENRNCSDAADDEGDWNGDPLQGPARDHQDARDHFRDHFAEGVDIRVAHVPPSQEIVSHEHVRESLKVPKLQDHQDAHAEGNEPFGGAQRYQSSTRGPSRCQNHRERCREDRDDG